MTPFDVSTAEFTNSNDYREVVDYIYSVRDARAQALSQAYPDYRIKPRCDPTPRSLFYYLQEHNVPFFDIICETLLHKDNCGYLELNEFAYQLDCFSKTIFHRKLWADNINGNHDKFLEFVWDDWNTHQHNNEFDNLKKIADKIFSNSNSLTEYHREFIYNPNYNFITVNDVKQIFDELVQLGVFLSVEGNLYKVFEGVSFDDADTDTKSKIRSGKIGKIDILYIRSKFKVETLPKLQSLKTKFNFVPVRGDLAKFEETVVQIKLSDKVWFIPQFLIFYN